MKLEVNNKIQHNTKEWRIQNKTSNKWETIFTCRQTGIVKTGTSHTTALLIRCRWLGEVKKRYAMIGNSDD